MLPTIYDHIRREELLARLQRLRPDAAGRWGRMSAPKMVVHLDDACRLASGELQLPRMFVPLRPLVKWVALYVLPFPRSAPTSRGLLERRPASWDADLARLRDRIAAVREPGPDDTLGEHPLFGRMTARDWGVLLYKHCDHHFRQFGI